MESNIAVREELVNCFFEAHKEFMKKGLEKAGMGKSEKDLKNDIEDMVRLAFKEANGNFENPSKQDFMNVMGVLQRKARAAGRDERIIQKHAARMMELVNEMK